MSYNKYINSPKKPIAWKQVNDHTLRTPLGEDDCSVLAAKVGGSRVLKEGEDARIRRTQTEIFCRWLIKERESMTASQLEYLLYTFGIRQAHLAKALDIEASAISQFIKGRNKFKKSTHRQLACLFIEEVNRDGYIKSLAENIYPEPGIHTYEQKTEWYYGYDDYPIEYHKQEGYTLDFAVVNSAEKAA